MPRKSDLSVLICTGMEEINAVLAAIYTKEGFGSVIVVNTQCDTLGAFHRILLLLAPALVILGPECMADKYIELIHAECGSKYKKQKPYHPSMPEIRHVSIHAEVSKINR